jgi:hypothetical protein
MDALFDEYAIADMDTFVIELSDVIIKDGVTIGPFSSGDCIKTVIVDIGTGDIQFCKGHDVLYSTVLIFELKKIK